MTSNTHEAAREYHRQGLPIVLCRPGAKDPYSKGWPSKHWTLGEIDREFRSHGDLNVGTRLGPAAKFIDIEFDSPDGPAALLDLFEGNVPTAPTWKSARGEHRLFQWHPDLAGIGTTVVHFGPLEIRIGADSKGCQSLLPPSVTDGVPRIWYRDLLLFDDLFPPEFTKPALRRVVLLGGGQASSVVNTEYTEPLHVYSVLTSDEAIRQAIRLTVPSAAGHRNRALFNFARHLRAIPSLAGSDSASLRPIIEKWWTAALPYISTKDFDETLFDFQNALKAVKFPAGTEPLHAISQRAMEQPLPRAAERYTSDSLRRMIMLCRELQREAGDKPFYLACRAAGEKLGISYVLANKWTRQLVDDHVLSVVRVGKRNRASEYRYLWGD